MNRILINESLKLYRSLYCHALPILQTHSWLITFKTLLDIHWKMLTTYKL